ncbi:MAG: aldose 1-epimerase [Solirubrobacteraceae bacterium]|nr:aldose 1-epimerase [Solirubrobacteraceae bacterium]
MSPWPSRVRLRRGDLGIVEPTSPDRELVRNFATGAGMVRCSLRHRGDEGLGIGEGLEAYLEEGAVFGVPLLYPWANRLGGWSYEAAGRTVTLDRSSPLLHADDRTGWWWRRERSLPTGEVRPRQAERLEPGGRARATFALRVADC